MKNIAIILTCLYGGGAERIAGLLSKELSKVYNVYLFLFDVQNTVYEYGGTIVDLSSHDVDYEEAIKSYKKKYSIDVSISFMEPNNFVNIKTRVGEKVIISERCTQSLFATPNVAEEMQIRRFYNYADEMVACSWGVKYEQETHYGITIPITAIYNFINKELIERQAQQELDKDVNLFLNGSEYFINVGRLDEQKNQCELIRQFAYFNRNIDSNKKLLILGSGEKKDELEVLIAQNGLENYIRIVSYGKNPFRYMKKSLGLLVTSRYEGLPNVVLEAMTIGCPVVSYDCLSGPRELLDDNINYASVYNGIHVGKRGIIVESNTNEYYFAEAMTLVQDKSIRDSLVTNGYSYMETYSNDVILQKWIEVIERERQEKEGSIEDFIRLQFKKPTYIYGAGKRGKYCYEVLSQNYKIDGFVVTQKVDGEETICGVPIYELSEITDTNAIFIMGVTFRYQNAVVNELLRSGYNNIIF